MCAKDRPPVRKTGLGITFRFYKPCINLIRGYSTNSPRNTIVLYTKWTLVVTNWRRASVELS